MRRLHISNGHFDFFLLLQLMLELFLLLKVHRHRLLRERLILCSLVWVSANEPIRSNLLGSFGQFLAFACFVRLSPIKASLSVGCVGRVPPHLGDLTLTTPLLLFQQFFFGFSKPLISLFLHLQNIREPGLVLMDQTIPLCEFLCLSKHLLLRGRHFFDVF